MEYRNLGRTGLLVSPLCLGTMNFSQQTDEPESARIMDRALDAGINFFDTANVYGDGGSEEFLGRWFAAEPARRDKVVLATKVYVGRDPWPNTRGLSALHIRQACDASLLRLQTDHIDLYQFHHIERSTPWEEIWQAIEVLVAQGKVIYAGSSNFAAWNIVAANEAAARRNLLGLVSEQSLYNIKARTVELEVLPACQAYGVGIIPWSPLAGGLLGGVLDGVDGGRRSDANMRRRIERSRDVLENWESLCRELGEHPANVAVAWLLHQPAVTAPIIGPRTLEQLNATLSSTEITLDAGALARLDELFPGPGGQAPEAYAW